MLANGVCKTRRGHFGSAEPSQRWSISLLSTGEVRVDGRLARAGSRSTAGQEVRLVDVIADDRHRGAFDDLHSAVFGDAGPAFVEKLMLNGIAGLSKVRTVLDGFLKAIKGSTDVPLDGRASRVAERFALIANAGELATFWGLTGWRKGAALNAAQEVFLAWIAQHSDQQDPEVETAVERIRAFVQLHEAGIQDLADGTITPSPTAKGRKEGVRRRSSPYRLQWQCAGRSKGSGTQTLPWPRRTLGFGTLGAHWDERQSKCCAFSAALFISCSIRPQEHHFISESRASGRASWQDITDKRLQIWIPDWKLETFCQPNVNKLCKKPRLGPKSVAEIWFAIAECNQKIPKGFRKFTLGLPFVYLWTTFQGAQKEIALGRQFERPEVCPKRVISRTRPDVFSSILAEKTAGDSQISFR